VRFYLPRAAPPTESRKIVKTPVVSVKPEVAKVSPDTPQITVGKRKPNEAPNGDVAIIVTPGNRVQITDRTNSSRVLDSDTLHPPAGERGLIGISPQSATFLDDGTLLVGVGDGTLVLLDTQDNPKWSIGFRGAVTGIVPADDNRAIITTQRGVVASVNTTNGQVIWEKHLTSGALTPAIIGADDHIYVAGPRGVLAFNEDGSLVFSHAISLPDDICCSNDAKEHFAVDASGHITAKGLDIRVSDPHPAIVDAIPIYVTDYEKVLDEKITAMIAPGPDELLLLVEKKKSWELLRYSGGTVKRFSIPKQASKVDRISADEKLEKPSIDLDELAFGPNGTPWLLGRAVFTPPDDGNPWWIRPAKGMILELVGSTVRERNDLKAAFDQHLVTSDYGSHIRAAENAPSHLFCFGQDGHACAIYNGAQPEIVIPASKSVSINVIGKRTYVVTDSGAVERLDGKQFIPIPVPEKERYATTAVGGTGENDLWFTNSGYVAYHWDGKTFSATSVPQSIESGVVARTPTDVWSRNGRVHWDGQRWSNVAGAQFAAGLVVRDSGDVWVGNTHGLFRGKPAKRVAIRLPEAKSADTKPLEAPKTMTLGAAQAGYTIAKTSLIVKGGAPVSTAKRLEVARDGTLWIEAWDRLVEVDAEGKTTVIDKEEKRITFDRWFYPESPGKRHFFTSRSGIRRPQHS
jgi:hypothetical protein